MIVVGYQGIGKSTLAGKNHNYIDLESGNFWVDGKRADDWYKPYCQIAEHLSQQGYVVFTSSHEVVRKQFLNSSEKVYAIVPSSQLKEKWLDKLRTLYQNTGLSKDFKALANAEDRYEENIKEIINSGLKYWVIDQIDYNLEEIIEKLEKNDL